MSPASDGVTSSSTTAFGPHSHDFLGHDHVRNESRVWKVIALTVAMMVLEIVAGSVYGSMALIADGWHMATHAGAMLITALAYAYARRHADDPRFTFGTGKVGDLAGFASAVILALIAGLIAWESLGRLLDPVAIHYGEALAVAGLGLLVNLASAWLLKDEHVHGHEHQHGHGHDHHRGHHEHLHEATVHAHGESAHAHVHPDDHVQPRDNNLRAAYIHVLADALTSVLAIVALLLGRAYGWTWADPLMGLVGAAVILRWSWGLIRDAARVLLDAVPEAGEIRAEILEALAGATEAVTDLHVWQVGPGRFAAIVALAPAGPRGIDDYRARLVHIHELAHVTVELAWADPVSAVRSGPPEARAGRG